MGKGRLEAFSDGVIAIIITIMVLEMKVPHGDSLESLLPLVPVFLSYVLSFVYVGIYWNNHHHMLHASVKVSGSVLWANLHLLFWLSLFPFATGWMGENHFAPMPSALYGAVLLMAAVAYWVLQQAIIAAEGSASVLKTAVGERLERQAVSGAVPDRHRFHLLGAVARADPVRPGCAALAGTGSAHRACTATPVDPALASSGPPAPGRSRQTPDRAPGARSPGATEAAEGVRLDTDAHAMIATIERVFAAVREDDHARLDEDLCEDFHAFENGAHMTGRELLDLMRRYYAEGKRYRWSVNSPQIEVQGNLGVVVYVNHGSIVEAPGADPTPMSWLETVLLRRQDSRWRVAFLHSTRARAAQSAT